MSTDTASIPTSTPKATTEAQKILRENFSNFSMIDRENGKFKYPRSVKKNRPAKENLNRSKQRHTPTKEDLAEKRRLQAIEAMKIAEQRRIRLTQEESTEEESLELNMTKLNISGIEYLSDGRIKLTKQQLAQRHEKRRRIQEHLAEQEARKRAEARKNHARGSRKYAYRPKSWAWSPRSVYRFNLKPRVIINNCKKTPAVAEELPVTLKKHVETQIPEKIIKIIRYTKDELREFNPYGFYCM